MTTKAGVGMSRHHNPSIAGHEAAEQPRVRRDVHAAGRDRRESDGQRNRDDRPHARGELLAREQRREDEQRADPREGEEEGEQLALAELAGQLREAVHDPISLGMDA